MAPPLLQTALKPLSLRVTPLQYARLQEHRAVDSMSIQEHIRRALDQYLERLDRKKAIDLAVAGRPAQAGSATAPKRLPADPRDVPLVATETPVPQHPKPRAKVRFR